MSAQPAKHPLHARLLALRILEQAGIKPPVQALLDAELRSAHFPRQEAALTTELVYGYLRSKIRISWLLGLFLKAPQKLPEIMKDCMGLAVYELLYLDRIPAHASVNAAVDMIRKRFGQQLARVANGVLRSFIRLQEQEASLLDRAFYAARIPDPLTQASVFHSIPAWMLQLWIDGYGIDQAEQIATAMSLPPHLCVRVNSAREGWQELRQELCTIGSPIGFSGVRFPLGKQPDSLRALHRQGLLSFQGAGSQTLLHALEASTWDAPLWDACAGYGGKTLALCEQGKHISLASDVSLLRLRGLREDAKRLQLLTPLLACASASKPSVTQDSNKAPQTILLDVPCSGLGTLARHPDLRLLRSPQDLKGLIALQQDILSTAWKLLPYGGKLVYTTCTLNPAENEHQITKLLSQAPDAKLLRQYQSAPDAYGSDLMFGAVLEKA